MKNLYSNDNRLFLVLILFVIIKSSCQTVYSCNANASCGCSRQSAVLSRIVGGENATSGTWSWAVSLYIADTYLCGGSIISSSWVITAAHCVLNFKASQVIVYAGSIRRFTGTQTRVASQIIIHPSYSSKTYLNDIALLKLATPLTMTDPYVGSICIPSISSETLSTSEWPEADTTVVAVGWGKLNETGSLPLTLQQVTLKTVSYQASTCAPLIRNWHTQLCAGVQGGGKGVCNGDSGGPLMMFNSNNQWILVGLTSYGIGCAEAAYSAVYTRIAAYQSWIYSNTNGSFSSVDSSAYTYISSSTLTTNLTSTAHTVQSHRYTFATMFLNVFLLLFLDLITVHYA